MSKLQAGAGRGGGGGPGLGDANDTPSGVVTGAGGKSSIGLFLAVQIWQVTPSP